VPRNRTRLGRNSAIGIVLVLVLALIGYRVYGSFQHTTIPVAAPPGCQAGTGATAISMDSDQAAIAATIAGVAARHKLPEEAVTIAYAAAIQESQLHNLDYGDRDSVGVFQQRPSQGWGTKSELENPVYATTKFFAALVQVPGYATMPVDEAAQDVQHSGDGSAYEQWASVAAQLAGYFTGASPHGVSCWYVPPARPSLANVGRSLTETFGPQGGDRILVAVTTARSGKKKPGDAVVQAQRDAAWTVAGWLVAHAQDYGISEVRYAGYDWTAADGSMGWQREVTPSAKTNPARGSIVAG
jgi:hypothetical protein